MKIRVQKVLLSSCGEIEPSSIFSASFLKATVLNDENYAFSRSFKTKTAEVNAKNECVTISKQKCYSEFYRF